MIIRRTAPLLWAALAALAVMSPAHAQEDDGRYGGYRIMERSVIGSGAPHILSPDGETILQFPAAGTIVVRSGDQFQEVRTISYDPQEYEFGAPDVRTLAWGPESQRVAMVPERPFVYMREPDIVLLDPANGTLQTVTPDEAGQQMWTSSSIDVNPQWAGDPDRLFFVRGSAGDERGTWLYSADLATGRLHEEQRLHPETPYHVYPRMLAFDDGRRFLLNRDAMDWRDPEVGIWLLDSPGGRLRKLVAAQPEPLAVPWLLELDRHGRSFLFYYVYRNAMPTVARFSRYDLESGQITPVDPAELPGERTTINATFSPDGQAMLYAVSERREGGGIRFLLYLRTLASDDPVLLLETDQPMGVYDSPISAYSRALQWAERNRVLVRIGEEDHLLVIGQ